MDHLRADIVLFTTAAHFEDDFRLSVIKTPKSLSSFVVDSLESFIKQYCSLLLCPKCETFHLC